jgi:hypothetical protein
VAEVNNPALARLLNGRAVFLSRELAVAFASEREVLHCLAAPIFLKLIKETNDLVRRSCLQ